MHKGNKIALNASHREIQAKKILPPHIVFLNPGKLELQEIWLPLASITPSTHPRSSSHLQPQRYQGQRLSRGQGISHSALSFCFFQPSPWYPNYFSKPNFFKMEIKRGSELTLSHTGSLICQSNHSSFSSYAFSIHSKP
jgi:hypothetical protein